MTTSHVWTEHKTCNQTQIFIFTPAEEVHAPQVATGGLFIAEDVGVKVVDRIRCAEGEDEGDGPDNQNYHVVKAMKNIVWVSGSQGNVPVWAPVVAWERKQESISALL